MFWSHGGGGSAFWSRSGGGSAFWSRVSGGSVFWSRGGGGSVFWSRGGSGSVFWSRGGGVCLRSPLVFGAAHHSLGVLLIIAQQHRPAQTTAAQLNTVTQNHPLTNWVTIN